MKRAIALGVATCTACGGSSTSIGPGDGSPPSDAPTPDGAPSMNVVGSGTTHFVSDTGVADVPQDFTTTAFTSYTPHGARLDLRTGGGSADGTFVVPVGLDAASWELGFRRLPSQPTEYVVGNATALDLSRFALGRRDAVVPTQSTPLTIDVTGLTPWASNDDLEILSSNAGAMVFSPQRAFPPPFGATSITNQTVDWLGFGAPLVDATAGDKTVMFQLSTKTTGTLPYTALSGIATAENLTLHDGQPATATFAMTRVPQDESATIHWNRLVFDALVDDTAPAVALAYLGPAQINITALPGGGSRGLFSDSPDLVEFVRPTIGFQFDETFTYGDPFETGGVKWDKLAVIRNQYYVSFQTTGSQIVAGYVGVIPARALGTITPTIHPVHDIQVDGESIHRTPTVVHRSDPLVTWEPPAVGAADNYRVVLCRLNDKENSVTELARFDTTGTSLQPSLPPLGDHEWFFFVVTAIASNHADYGKAPFLDGIPYAAYTSVSAPFAVLGP